MHGISILDPHSGVEGALHGTRCVAETRCNHSLSLYVATGGLITLPRVTINCLSTKITRIVTVDDISNNRRDLSVSPDSRSVESQKRDKNGVKKSVSISHHP